MFQKPNYHNVPNEFVDDYLKNLTGSESKILSVIFRKTFGFHKDFDYISVSQFVDYTGLSHQTIITSTKSLLEKDLITIKYKCTKCNSEFLKIENTFICPTCHTKEMPDRLFGIAINENEGGRAKIMRGSLIIRPPGRAKIMRGSLIIRPEVVKLFDGQKETVQKGEIENNFLEAKKLSLALAPKETFVPGPIVESEKNIFEEKTASAPFFLEKEKESEKTDEEFDQESFECGKKLVEEFYPFYFVNAEGGPMNTEKRKLIVKIGFAWNCIDPEVTKKTMADVASTLKQPSNLLAWTVERLDKLMKVEQNGNNNNKR